jgi:hypothetical protein
MLVAVRGRRGATRAKPAPAEIGRGFLDNDDPFAGRFADALSIFFEIF